MAYPVSDPVNPEGTLITLRRWLPLAFIVGLIIAAFAFGLQEHLKQGIAANCEALRHFIENNWTLALLIYAVVYVVAVALSFPAAGLLTIIGGLLFGWLAAVITVVFAATTGATIIFLFAKTKFEKIFTRKSGPLMTRIKEGFTEDAFNYLLFIRFVPLFPFWLVNIAAALAHLRLRTFIFATFLGIIPITVVFSFVGASLAQNGAASCKFDLSPSHWVTPQIIIAFSALCIVALAPVVIKKLMAKP